MKHFTADQTIVIDNELGTTEIPFSTPSATIANEFAPIEIQGVTPNVTRFYRLINQALDGIYNLAGARLVVRRR